MKASLLFILAGLSSLTACQQSSDVAPNENVAALHEKFHGTYKPIHSESNLALDINLDGTASTDMLEEISDLPNMLLEVSIFGKNQHNPKPSFLFVHHWPQQSFGRVEPTDFDPNIKPLYARKVVVWRFAFDSDFTQLLLEPQPPTLTDPELYTPPHSVLVKGNGLIEVTLSKRLYTTKGWKTVQIVSLYERL
ncbi:hypothetical protein ACMA1I_17480 [Pontibacter sp. 13R65]|uniref:hypothetical protein n=1 Tax=Pontibacter sp. 13R65 TaxID=3127458 RepID=UPI00301D1BBD